jgi:hypothetical protein
MGVNRIPSDSPGAAAPSPGDVAEYCAAVRGEGWLERDAVTTSPRAALWWGDALLVLSPPDRVSGRLLVTSLRCGWTGWVHDTWLSPPTGDPLVPWDWCGGG